MESQLMRESGGVDIWSTGRMTRLYNVSDSYDSGHLGLNSWDLGLGSWPSQAEMLDPREGRPLNPREADLP